MSPDCCTICFPNKNNKYYKYMKRDNLNVWKKHTILINAYISKVPLFK